MTTELFQSLLKLMDEPKSMDSVYERLLEQVPSKRSISYARKHKPQNLQSCTYKSLTSTAQSILPQSLYRNFKLWDTQEMIKKLELLGKELTREMESSGVSLSKKEYETLQIQLNTQKK